MGPSFAIVGMVSLAISVLGNPSLVHHPGYAFAAGLVLVVLSIPITMWEHVHVHRTERSRGKVPS